MLNIAECQRRDAAAKPNATDFCAWFREAAEKLPKGQRAAFLAGAIRAAELCGHATFAFHLAIEHRVDPWGQE
jgi:hypothetical protein